MPCWSAPHSRRLVRSRRALAALFPVVGLLCSPVGPAGAADESASSGTVTQTAASVGPTPPSAPVLPSDSALGSWGTAKVSGRSKSQRVNAVVEAGGVAYLGGEFTQMVHPDRRSVSRGYLAAIDGATGNLTSWNPQANGKVWSLELSADGSGLYVGGDFSKIGGRSVSKLARIDLATGKVDSSFKARWVKGRVRALKLDGARLYVGGEFGSIDGQTRPKLAALDAANGALLPWMPPPLNMGRYLGHTGESTPDYEPGHVFAVEVIGARVFAAGTFTDFGGQGGLLALDGVTGLPTELQYTPERPIFDLAARDGVLYAAAGGTGGRLYAFGPEDDRPLWKVKVDGDAVGVAVSATTVYLAGHYDYVISEDSSCQRFCPDGPHREHLSAFSAVDGGLLAWAPSADTNTGPFTVAVGANALYVGGEFFEINGRSQPGFSVFPGTP